MEQGENKINFEHLKEAKSGFKSLQKGEEILQNQCPAKYHEVGNSGMCCTCHVHYQVAKKNELQEECKLPDLLLEISAQAQMQ